MVIVGIIKLAVIFAIGLQPLDFFTTWLLGGNVPPALGMCLAAFGG